MSYLEQRRKFIEDGRPLPPKKKYVISKKSAKRIQKEKEQGIEIVKPKRKAGWFDCERADLSTVKDEPLQWKQSDNNAFDSSEVNRCRMDECAIFPKSSLPTSFTPTKEQLNDANDVVKEFKLGERGKSEIWDWFLDRREEMVGVCQHCSQPSLKNSDRFFHHSVCHVLPKSYFKSVATHKRNFVELCQDCHNGMDNCTIDLIDMNCFSEIVDKVVAMYPDIAPNERKKIPAILREYIKTDTL